MPRLRSWVRAPSPAPVHGSLAQLVSAPACHAGGHGFEPRTIRHSNRRLASGTPSAAPGPEECTVRLQCMCIAQLAEQRSPKPQVVGSMPTAHALKLPSAIPQMVQPLRTCKICLQAFPLKAFALAGTVNSVVYRRHLCSPCYTAQKNTARQAKADWFDDFKRGLRCAHCGNNDHRVLQFHHRNPDEKESSLADRVSTNKSKARILSEVAKCDCLCANCHLIVHYEERRPKNPSFA